MVYLSLSIHPNTPISHSKKLSRSKFSHLSLCACSRRICFCSLGFPQDLQSEKAKNEFLDEVARVEEFFKDPWLLRVRDEGTVQVAVPKVVPPPPPPVAGECGGGCGDPDELSLSAMTKRVALQRKAAVASMAAEDYARRFESGDFTVRFLVSLLIAADVVFLL